MSFIEETIKKYTAVTVSVDDLRAKQTPVDATIIGFVMEIEASEQDLKQASRGLRYLADKIDKYLAAKPGEKVLAFRGYGELNGSQAGDVDMTIGVFLARCKTLSVLVAARQKFLAQQKESQS